MPRRVLVTGANSGLGLALTQRWAAAGDRVVATDRHRVPDGTLAEMVGAGRVAYQALDVTSDADWEAARTEVERRLGGLDVLVNNAGIAAGGRIERLDTGHWHRILEVNLLGVVRGCRTFTPLFQQQRSGHIVNIASAAGLVHPPAMASYNATKAAVVAVSETLGYELEPYGVRTSVICPSFFRTNLGDSFEGSDPEVEAVARRLISGSRRSTDEVADAVVAGVAAGRRVVLPDREARMAFWAKRLARPLYDRRMRAMARRMHTATGTS